MTELVPRATVKEICAKRDESLRLYEIAAKSLLSAEECLKRAYNVRKDAAPLGDNRYNYHLKEQGEESYIAGFRPRPTDEFMERVRRVVDTEVWSHVIKISDLETLMDKKAKDDLNKELVENPPEATVENIYATLQQFGMDAGTIFRRGIANVFSDLDRRFRSHNGWKIGSRVILSYAFNEWGSWNYHRNHEDTLIDIERTFKVLDGEKPMLYGGIVDLVRQDRRGMSGARQSEIESDYFKVRIFKNGNCHIWFKRDDLVEQVNKLLGEYYGDVIPEERKKEDQKEDPLANPKTAIAKNFAFFPTPDAVADRVIEETSFGRHWKDESKEPQTVLEPSAGTGNLARRAVAKDAVVDCVEIQSIHVLALKAEGIYRKVIQADFMKLTPDPENLYDRVIMNPPFDRERDIDHVFHAFKFLKPGGRLVAVMSAGTEFRETRKSVAFRALMDKYKAEWRDLPAGSFSSVGTYVNTLLLTVWKPSEPASSVVRAA